VGQPHDRHEPRRAAPFAGRPSGTDRLQRLLPRYHGQPAQAFATLKAGLPGVLPLVIKDAAVRQQVTAFTTQHAGQADGGPATVKDARFGGYRVSIHGVSGATIRKNGRSASSFSTSVNIYGPSEY
jgi:hypothetical protein